MKICVYAPLYVHSRLHISSCYFGCLPCLKQLGLGNLKSTYAGTADILILFSSCSFVSSCSTSGACQEQQLLFDVFTAIAIVVNTSNS